MATTPREAAAQTRRMANNKQAALDYIASHVHDDSNIEAIELDFAIGFGRCLALASDSHFERCIAAMRKARESF